MTPGNEPSSATFTPGDISTGTLTLGDVPGVDYGYLLNEDGGYILLEEGGRIIIDEEDHSVNYSTGGEPSGSISVGSGITQVTFTPPS